MKDRPTRSKKSTKLKDYWYETQKKKRGPRQNPASPENENVQRSQASQPEVRSPSPEVLLEDQNLIARRSLTPETAQDPKTTTPVTSKTPKQLLEELFLGSRLESKFQAKIKK